MRLLFVYGLIILLVLDSVREIKTIFQISPHLSSKNHDNTVVLKEVKNWDWEGKLFYPQWSFFLCSFFPSLIIFPVCLYHVCFTLVYSVSGAGPSTPQAFCQYLLNGMLIGYMIVTIEIFAYVCTYISWYVSTILGSRSEKGQIYERNF